MEALRCIGASRSRRIPGAGRFPVLNPEVFYLHLEGAQRGPYTAPQIDHLLNSGLIQEDTLFWRDGLEDWQPVTALVTRRKKGRRWVKSGVAAGLLLLVALVLRLFASTIHVGWQETNQHEFTAESAYWRGRDFVRHQAIPEGSIVEFCPLNEARVTLAPPDSATLQLHGTLSGAHGATSEAAWIVSMTYDPLAKEWSGAAIKEAQHAP